MIQIDASDIQKQLNTFLKSYSNGAGAPLLYDSFVAKTHTLLASTSPYKYPMDIKIPKSINALAQGDFEPAYVIHLEKPLYREAHVVKKDKAGNQIEQTVDVPIWFNSSSKVIYLRFGYKNGDSRYCSMQCVGDSNVHAFIGGATGQGKSVALNNLIFNVAEEYAPWEVQFTMCDAKIVEFKAYAGVTHLPHIRSIAACSDADYQISILEHLKKEMEMRNTFFGFAGAKKLEEFRANTGLFLPRNLIIMDEVQTAFKYAGKKSQHLIDIIDSFARLGRSTGYHLIMASQEIDSSIPTDTLGNIKMRGALGCTAHTSETLIGNDEAKLYYGKPGNIIINTDGGDKTKNVLYRTPYISTKCQHAVESELYSVGRRVGFVDNLNFYDEEKKLFMKDYVKYLEQFPIDGNSIYLGEPSYVVTGKYKVTKLDLIGDNVENICVLNINAKNLLRFFVMLKENILLQMRKGIPIYNHVLCTNDFFLTEGGLVHLASNKIYTDRFYMGNEYFEIARNTIERRKLMLKIDERVFDNNVDESRVDELFNSMNFSDVRGTQLTKSRVFFAHELLTKNVEFMPMIDRRAVTKEEKQERVKKLIKITIDTFESYGCANHKLTKKDFPRIYNWVIEADRIMGLFKDSKAKYVEELKLMLSSCTELNIRFIIITNDLGDAYGIRENIGWFILDETSDTVLNNIRCPDFPAVKKQSLAVLYARNPNESGTYCFKFKKIVMDGDIF